MEGEHLKSRNSCENTGKGLLVRDEGTVVILTHLIVELLFSILTCGQSHWCKSRESRQYIPPGLRLY